MTTLKVLIFTAALGLLALFTVGSQHGFGIDIQSLLLFVAVPLAAAGICLDAARTISKN